MTHERAEYLRQCCHDYAVHIKAQIAAGKRIPSPRTMAELFMILEEVLQHIEQA